MKRLFCKSIKMPRTGYVSAAGEGNMSALFHLQFTIPENPLEWREMAASLRETPGARKNTDGVGR